MNRLDLSACTRLITLTLVVTLLHAAPALAAHHEEGEAAGETAKPVTKTSGLIYQELVAGAGASPSATDRVTVHYTGKLESGDVFDSSEKRGKPATFPLNRVIKSWTEGVQLMKVGGKATLTCPGEIAYGAKGRPPRIPPNATLLFDIELLGIN
jgi:FKBP-type peptidyl-prolyl cis-trans isomerase FkpA